MQYLFEVSLFLPRLFVSFLQFQFFLSYGEVQINGIDKETTA